MGLIHKKYTDHIIICGLGATSLQIIDVLETSREKTPQKNVISKVPGIHDYLVIDSSEEAIEKIKSKWPRIKYIVGDATDDDMLEKANIKDAFGIFPILASEKDNLYITMAARQLNPKIRIVARTADVQNNGKKFFKGGASAVVSPNLLGGLRLVSEIVRPNATDFLDKLLHEASMTLQIEEMVISGDSTMAGLSLNEINLPEKCGLIVLAIKKRGRISYTYNPKALDLIETGDTIVSLGYSEQINELKALANPKG